MNLKPECLPLPSIADNLFPGTDPVGQTLRLANLPFRVMGVMTRKGQDHQGRDQDDTAFAPYTTVQKKILGNTVLRIAYVSAVSQDATYTAQQQITELLRQRHKLSANEPSDFTVRNMTDIAEAANETKQHHDDPLGLYRERFVAGGRHRHHEYHVGFAY